MKIKALICESLQRSFYYYSSQKESSIDIEPIEIRYHEYPGELKKLLQRKVDSIPKGKYDYIILGYGLCGNVLEGLKSNNIPLIIPRVHDCIHLYLHQDKKYLRELKENPGCMYYINSMMEINGIKNVSNQLESIGFGNSYKEMVEVYGKENADYLYGFVEDISQSYNTCVYIENKRCESNFIKEIKEIAKTNQWSFVKRIGKDTIIEDLVHMHLNSEYVIKVEPFHQIKYVGHEKIMEIETIDKNVDEINKIF